MRDDSGSSLGRYANMLIRARLDVDKRTVRVFELDTIQGGKTMSNRDLSCGTLAMRTSSIREGVEHGSGNGWFR